MTKIQAIKNLITELKNIQFTKLDKTMFITTIISIVVWIVNLFSGDSKKVFIFQNPLNLQWEFIPGKKIGMTNGISIYSIENMNPNYVALTYSVTNCGFTCIVTNSIYESYLTAFEKEAVIAHEIGHIVLDHHAGAAAGWLITEENELAADNYAAGKIGKKAMKSCLKKIIAYGKSVSPELSEIYDNAFESRLEALL